MAKTTSPIQTLAKAVGGKVETAKAYSRIVLDGERLATVYTRSNSSLAIYVAKDVRVTGELKKQTRTTTEGLRLKTPADELALAHELLSAAKARVEHERNIAPDGFDEPDAAVRAS